MVRNVIIEMLRHVLESRLDISSVCFDIEKVEFGTELMKFYPLVNGRRVGYANIVVRGKCWRLADIYIENKIPLWKRYFVFDYKAFKQLRSIGIGSRLLNHIIVHAKACNAEYIEGRMAGDVERLKKWYSAHGFSILEDNNIKLVF